jgi:DNA polymerase-1
MNDEKTIYVIDGAGYYFRAFYAIRQALTNAQGVPTNAVLGFANMLRKIIREKRPPHLVMALDSKEKTFRHERYADYKANRSAMPEELARQLPYIDRLIDGFNVPTLKVAGWEADDLIGAVARLAREHDYNVVVVSSDKDLMQLVGPGVTMYDSMKDVVVGPDEVREKFGVGPERVADALGLMGDSSDNIPGVPGVGPKRAAELLVEYGDVEAVLAAAPAMKPSKLRDNLIAFAGQARLSKELATVACDAPVVFDPAVWTMRAPDVDKLRELYAELELASLLKELKTEGPKLPRAYTPVVDEATFAAMIDEMRAAAAFAFDTETTSPRPVEATLVGMSFCATPGRAYYLPLRHDRLVVPERLDWEAIKPAVAALLEDPAIKKWGHNIKYDMIVMAGEGVAVAGVDDDTMVASYLIDPAGKHGLSALAEEKLGEKTIEYKEVCGSGAKEITFDRVALAEATAYAAEDADMTARLHHLFGPELAEGGVTELMREMELPLVDVLVAMERAGMLVDTEQLAILSAELTEQMGVLEAKIHSQAGEPFNVNSPKQLATILFEKLGLPGGRKTKTGYSTSQDVLENLAAVHSLPADVVEYRQLAKLKNTYADALPKMVDAVTGRIHTSFNQTVAATGRLSSSEPNLQNIPVRTENGRRIRKAFVAPPGRVIVSADYSQIELRLMAHFSGEKKLIDAFHQGEDIHARTAAEVFGVDPLFVTADMRRVAKTVNFGVIYGQTPFGLSQELKISQAEAKRYIDNYFATYPGIRRYVGEIIASGAESGFVTTLSGRRRYLPDLTSSNRQAKQFAERNAVNTPMQGSAADLIKMAMITIHKRLAAERFDAAMVLQVHDELVFEVAEADAKRLTAMVVEEMEGVYELTVPLVVSVAAGANWDEAH